MAGVKGRSGGRRPGAGRKKGKRYAKLPDGTFAVRYGPKLMKMIDRLIHSRDRKTQLWVVDRLLPYIVSRAPMTTEIKGTLETGPRSFTNLALAKQVLDDFVKEHVREHLPELLAEAKRDENKRDKWCTSMVRAGGMIPGYDENGRIPEDNKSEGG